MAIRLDPDVTLRPLSVAELEQMVEARILTEDDRVELLDGVLVQVSPQSPDHAAVLRALLALVAIALQTEGLEISSQAPLEVGQEHCRPEPDLAIVRRPPVGSHPSEAPLVVEIAIASRATDLGRKAAIYAQAGVPEYWVVDVAARELVVHRQPVADRYRLVRRMAEGEAVDAAALTLRVEVDALFAQVGRA